MARDDARLVRMAAALAAADDLAYDWDMEADRIEWFGAAETLLPAAAATLARGAAFAALIEPQDRPRRIEALARHLGAQERFECRYRLRVDGGLLWVHERGRAETDMSGRILRLTGLLRPVSDAGQTEARLQSRDGLRVAIGESLARNLRARRSGSYLAIDVDNLAHVNDAFGFAAGDAVIAELGARLQRMLRGRDTVGRVEGGGFGLLLENCDERGLGAAAERIVRALREEPVETAAGPVAATVSLGGVVFPAGAQNADEAMTRAEIALQQAKRAGRNHFVMYRRSEAQRQSLRQDNGIAREVQRALAEDRLTLAFQPVVDSRTEVPAFYESLLRMRREDGQIVAAGEFVPVIEPLGMIREVDRRVLDLVVRELEADPGVTLAFNISGLTAGDERWLGDIVGRLKGRPDLATRLIVELTETAALQEIEESVRFVSCLRDLGCRIALDDFGAGYSSFRHLKSLPVDIVKLDGSFVRGLAARPENRLFIRTLLGLAGAFGLASVAECVETAEEADLLSQEGVAYLQGWHFGRPELTRAAPAAPIALPLRAEAFQAARKVG